MIESLPVFWEILLLIISNMLCIFTRTYNILHIAELKIFKSIISGTLLTLSWLMSTAIGMNALINGSGRDSWIVVSIYVVAGTLGQVLAMKHKIRSDSR